MISSDDFPCYVDIYKQEKVHSPSKEGYSVDEVVWMTSMNQYLHWITDIDAPMGHTRGEE